MVNLAQAVGVFQELHFLQAGKPCVKLEPLEGY
jgi:hypothetical protein